jgi:hypothetical protein
MKLSLFKVKPSGSHRSWEKNGGYHSLGDKGERDDKGEVLSYI